MGMYKSIDLLLMVYSKPFVWLDLNSSVFIMIFSSLVVKDVFGIMECVCAFL